jgi:hypothetical protein
MPSKFESVLKFCFYAGIRWFTGRKVRLLFILFTFNVCQKHSFVLFWHKGIHTIGYTLIMMHCYLLTCTFAELRTADELVQMIAFFYYNAKKPAWIDDKALYSRS